MKKISVVIFLCVFFASSSHASNPSSAASQKTISPQLVRKIEQEFTDFCIGSQNPSSFVDEPVGIKANLAGLSPGAAVVNALGLANIKVVGEVKATVTQAPKHGAVKMIGLATQSFPGLSLEEFEYTPAPEFFGEDHVEFEVIANGQKFHISIIVKVVDGPAYDACDPGVEGDPADESSAVFP